MRPPIALAVPMTTGAPAAMLELRDRLTGDPSRNVGLRQHPVWVLKGGKVVIAPRP